MKGTLRRLIRFVFLVALLFSATLLTWLLKYPERQFTETDREKVSNAKTAEEVSVILGRRPDGKAVGMNRHRPEWEYLLWTDHKTRFWPGERTELDDLLIQPFNTLIVGGQSFDGNVIAVHLGETGCINGRIYRGRGSRPKLVQRIRNWAWRLANRTGR
jgi:hypothetical protein